MAKFTKESVSEKIRNILKTTGGGQELSDRTINDTLENLMIFASEEVELDAFVSQIQGGLISMNGNMRKEKADAAKAISEVEAEKARLAKIEADRNKAEEDAKGAVKSESEKKMDAILAKLEAQELKEAALAKKQATEAKITAARELLKAQGATDDAVLKYTLKGLDVSEDQTAEQIAATVLPQYNKDFKELKGDGVTPANPTQNLSATAALEAQAVAKSAVRKIVEKTGINVPEKTQV